MDNQTMTAALKTAEGTFDVKQVDRVRIPADDWVLMRVRVSGICGTDLRHWKKHEPDLECKIMGHELAGEIVEVGSKVTNVKVGDRVVVETLLGDGTCDWCRVQQYNLCPNLYEVRMETVSRAFAEYVIGPSTKFHKLPDHVSFEEATLLDTFSVGLHAQQLSGLKINDKVVIIGAGPIGLGQLQLAKCSGADVLIADTVDSSLKIALELGADEVVNVEAEDIYERVMQFTDHRGADVTFECAGGPSMPEVGGFDKGKTSIELEWQKVQMKEIRLIPSASYSFWGIYPEMKMCLDLLAKGKLKAKPLITHQFKLQDINEAFETADNKKETGAVFVALHS